MSTVDELVDYYAQLLIVQYKSKPKAYRTMQDLVRPLLLENEKTGNLLLLDIQDAFNVDTAVGKQLDIVGKYAGVTRYVNDFSGSITLNDSEFRQLIFLAIVQNHTECVFADIMNLFNEFFPGAFNIYDYETMRLSYFINPGFFSNQLAQVMVKENKLPKPLGVRLSGIGKSQSGFKTFGFMSSDYPAFNSVGFGDSGNYDNTVTWLNSDTDLV